jgi:hypothetical protein
MEKPPAQERREVVWDKEDAGHLCTIHHVFQRRKQQVPVAFFGGFGKRPLFCSVVPFFAGRFSVQGLYGGVVLQRPAYLVGFEGVMPHDDKSDKKMFGSNIGYLSYEPSSILVSFKYRDSNERMGAEPSWIKSGNPEDVARMERQLEGLSYLYAAGYRGIKYVCVLRTQTTDYSMIYRRKGWMLRTVLCSWRFKNDCLYSTRRR